MKRLFIGGIHPHDKKEMSAGSMPIPVPAPATLVVPMLQHIGAPCEPMVKPGDTVKVGQKIGDGTGLCVPVHSSVSGKVLAVEPRKHTSGREIMSVVIENDFQNNSAQTLKKHRNFESLTNEEILSIIREAGIVGMGGATFPTDAKAMSSIGKVNTIIANACECEPYITADDMLLRTCPEKVLGGMKIIYRVLQPIHAVLAVEDNKKDAISILKKLMENESRFELKILPTRYPQGAEKQLVQAVTGKQVPPDSLPSAIGCTVFNVSTFAAIYEAVVEGKPLTHRIVTVTGESVERPQNFIVPIGTPISHLIEAAGGLKESTWKVICGGPMMGIPQDDLEVPVIKGTNAVVCLSKKQKDEEEHPVCIRCGRCLTACPVALQPLYLYRYTGLKDSVALKRLNVTDCIECGCCAYVCPGKLPLVERLRSGKRIVKEESNK